MRETPTDTGGVVKGPRAWIAVSVTLFALLGVFGLGVSSASASSPWWHLTSGARPTYLHAGAAQSEIQELVTSPGAYRGGQVTEFVLSVGGHSLETFATEPLAAEAGLPLPTAANIQAALEKAYGGGNVTVLEEAAGKYRVTAAGEDAFRAVPRVGLDAVIGSTREKIPVAGHPDGEIVLKSSNLGDAAVDGANAPVKIKDILPPGLHAVGIVADIPLTGGVLNDGVPLPCSLQTLTCEMTSTLAPYDQIEVRIAVSVDPTAVDGELNRATVTGGEVPAVSLARPLTIKAGSTPFGVEDYELVNEEEGGGPATQAGAHPFQSTTTIALNQDGDTAPLENDNHHGEVPPAGLAKDLSFRWPAGLIGNPSPVPRCTNTQFADLPDGLINVNACPAQSAVGVAVVTVQEPFALHTAQFTEPLFNLEPGPGEPARFGFDVEQAGASVFIDTAVRTGSDYGVTVTTSNITQIAGFLSAEVTVWGVPGDPRHDDARGWGCLAAAREQVLHGACDPPNEEHPPAFLSLPTSCTGPQHTAVFGDSWENQFSPGTFPKLAEFEMPALDSCNRLPFSPSIEVTPDGNAGSTPTGLNVDIHVPQEESESAEGLAEAAPRDITVTLPEGVAVNPSAGDGLQSCSDGLAGFTGFAQFFPSSQTATFTERLPSPLQQGVNFCPEAAKVGTVKIKTPILPNAIEGSVYLASQNENPFGSLIALYLIAEDPVSGVLIKLVGETRLGANGQLTTTFKDSPQAPFEDAELHFFGGERAPLATPARCGAYTTAATLTPWSGNPPATSSSTFDITSGPSGSPCPGAALPFSPSLTGGTLNINAGAFSTLSTTIGREDGQQNLQSVQLHMPAGLSGILAGVKLCDEADANSGTCGPESQIGETTVSAGVGGDPVAVKGGRVYITETYAGAPFGLSIVNPVKAGPFDLEHDTSNPNQQPACDCVVVRAKIEVDPHTAALTITTDPSGSHAIPHLIDGIPVQIKKVNVLINRPGFTFNATNCAPFAITGSIVSDEGASSPVAVPFQVTNCATLKFAPKFSVSTSGKTSKANGASLTAKLSYPQGPAGTYADISRVKVDLPKQLPSRLTTLQKACTNAQFELNPAGCPKESKIGMATVTTPLLPVPLNGPAIFVSHGGEAFPSLTMVLQGYGVTVDLVGTTFISKAGVTSTTFKTVPDVPFNTFQLTLPQGKFSALAANGNLCTSKLAMPTEFLAQNGAKINESTKVSVTGCSKVKALTRSQKLAKALKACHKDKDKTKRASCEAKARKQHEPLKRAKKKGK
jgi:hypothetical protein